RRSFERSVLSLVASRWSLVMSRWSCAMSCRSWLMSLRFGACRIAGDGLEARGLGPAGGAATAAPDTPIDNIPNRVERSKPFFTIIFRFIDTLLLQTRIFRPTSASNAIGYLVAGEYGPALS